MAQYTVGAMNKTEALILGFTGWKTDLQALWKKAAGILIRLSDVKGSFISIWT